MAVNQWFMDADCKMPTNHTHMFDQCYDAMNGGAGEPMYGGARVHHGRYFPNYGHIYREMCMSSSGGLDQDGKPKLTPWFNLINFPVSDDEKDKGGCDCSNQGNNNGGNYSNGGNTGGNYSNGGNNTNNNNNNGCNCGGNNGGNTGGNSTGGGGGAGMCGTPAHCEGPQCIIGYGRCTAPTCACIGACSGASSTAVDAPKTCTGIGCKCNGASCTMGGLGAPGTISNAVNANAIMCGDASHCVCMGAGCQCAGDNCGCVGSDCACASTSGTCSSTFGSCKGANCACNTPNAECAVIGNGAYTDAGNSHSQAMGPNCVAN